MPEIELATYPCCVHCAADNCAGSEPHLDPCDHGCDDVEDDDA